MRKLVLLLILTIIVGCSNMGNSQKIKLKTKDGINLVANYIEGDDKVVILLHQFGKNKGSWQPLISKLKDRGYGVLAVDLRGHGESDLNFKDFSNEDFINMKYDLEAAEDFFEGKEIAVIGASIGANTILTSKNSKVGILLSPGLDYKGINSEELIERYENKILIIVSSEDKYSYESSVRLNEMKVDSELKVYDGLGHGTSMFASENVTDFIIDWLSDNF